MLEQYEAEKKSHESRYNKPYDPTAYGHYIPPAPQHTPYGYYTPFPTPLPTFPTPSYWGSAVPTLLPTATATSSSGNDYDDNVHDEPQGHVFEGHEFPSGELPIFALRSTSSSEPAVPHEKQ